MKMNGKRWIFSVGPKQTWWLACFKVAVCCAARNPLKAKHKLLCLLLALLPLHVITTLLVAKSLPFWIYYCIGRGMVEFIETIHTKY